MRYCFTISLYRFYSLCFGIGSIKDVFEGLLIVRFIDSKECK